MKNLRDKTTALAGVFQSAALVHQIATQGVIAESDLQTAIRSTLELDPPNTLAVFGQITQLRLGLQTLLQQMGNSARIRDAQIARYTISLLHLERRLNKQPQMLTDLRERLERAQQQSVIFGLTHENVLANLAGTYSDTISQLRPRIIVVGNETYLSNTKQTARIRAILLAGIRAAVLWSQVGGSRWQILWQRKVFVKEAERLLDMCT